MKNIDVKEKLVELLGENTCTHDYCEDCEYCEDSVACIAYLKNSMVDHLIANGVTLNERDCHWATEQAYKNGYKQGYEDGLRDRKRKEETTSSVISQRTVQALERMGQKVHGGKD